MKTSALPRTRRIDDTEIKRFQRILEGHLEEALRSLNRLGDETRTGDLDGPQDAGDRCVTGLSRESLFQQSGERRMMLRTIEAAIDRIKHGMFGICIACGKEINVRRLDALPWTRYCLRCQEALEHEHRDGADQRAVLRKAG